MWQTGCLLLVVFDHGRHQVVRATLWQTRSLLLVVFDHERH